MSKNKRKTVLLAVLIGVLLLLAAELVLYFVKEKNAASLPDEPEESEATPAPTMAPSPKATTEPEFEEYDITLAAFGDNIPHMGIVNTGKMSDGTLNYSFLFKGDAESILNKSDIKIISQETIMAGNEHGFSGSPTYNSPTEIADAIAGAGFDVVLHASDHTADMGLDGLQNCLTYWHSNYPDVKISGAHYLYDETTDRADRITVVEKKGYRFAILNYEYDPDIKEVPKDMTGRMDFLCEVDESTGKIDNNKLASGVIEDIKTAGTIADVVIVCPHWGTDYSSSPTDFQRECCNLMCEAGADIIIGTNPQGPQGVETLVSSDEEHKTLCYYSLGSYASTQKDGISMLEGVAYITWHVSEDGISIKESQTGVFPMVCHYTSKPTRMGSVFFLEDYTEELAEAHGIHDFGVNFTLDKLKTQSDELFADCRLYTDILKD